MTQTPTSQRRIIAIALVSLPFMIGGLSAAFLSNPKRFSLDEAHDRSIHLLAISGFACTLIGVVLFLLAVGHSTESMPARLRRNANIGVGGGFVLQLAGLALPELTRAPAMSGWILVVASLPAFIWGATHYAQGKGRAKSLGLLGAFGVLGLIVLALLPSRDVEHD